MRIVHVIGYFQPEYGYEEYYLAREQVKQGHNVHVITSNLIWPFPNISKKDRLRITGSNIVDGINVHRLKTWVEFRDFILFGGVKNILTKLKPDIIHVHEPRQGFYGLAIRKYAKSHNISYVVDIHEYHSGSFFNKLDYFIFRKRFMKPILNDASNIFSMTVQTKQFLEEKFKCKNSIYIPLGADSEKYYFSKNIREAIRAKLDIAYDEILLVFSGKITKTKGIEEIFNNVRYLLNKGYLVKLLLVGKGDKNYLSILKSSIKDIKNKVLFMDEVTTDELYMYFNAADIGIWPISPTISILEGLACGLPIIVADNEIVGNLVDIDSGVKMKSLYDHNIVELAIINLKEGRYQRKVIRKKFEDQFSYKSIAQRVEGIYQSIIRRDMAR
ncbi:glycosyltransferase family 4 protein [Fictibacillus barbaricus]|uniref:Glycosyltransferase involved in cell wall biosynthesis n=1 Tax=Fictibacillus barbaricus TaxID=182136 RepID=A0ABU1U1R9_9BACL|nr:glycosyltransferase family 4 protein [Fictibacillus barbaricus]MDR7073321.1 glycosyltransferase involved in cell wall biosynthesis [Fictibacillus barbaricus]